MIGRPTSSRSLAATVDVVVVGAGHAGLSMSHYLTAQSVDHVVLERGEIADAWRHERWDSLRLLTPNWQTRLPGYRYCGADPDGYMSMPEVVAYIDTYAQRIGAPVRTHTRVISISSSEDGYLVETDAGRWRCRAVVLACGAHGVPSVPSFGTQWPRSLRMLTTRNYRNPNQLEDRGVLIVGASATGVQLADEIQRSGRPVTLAVGEHIRMPRVYRGFDIQHWLVAAGILDQRYDHVDDIVRARRVPSPQLIGTPERRTLDLNALTARGVEIVGRLVGVNGSKAQFSGSLRNYCAMADLKLARLLDTIDAWIERNGMRGGVSAPQRYAPTRLEGMPRLSLDLHHARIGTVIWATGFRPDHSWLHVPAFDAKGRLRHDGGVVTSPGLYALGLNFMRRRKSSLIDGAEDDVRELSAHLVSYLDDRARSKLMRAAG